VATSDQRLLVGRGHDLAGAQRGEHRTEADDTAGGDDHDVDVVTGGERLKRICSPDALDGGWEIETRECSGVTKSDGTRPQPAGLLP
jgi:hypothetical protein